MSTLASAVSVVLVHGGFVNGSGWVDASMVDLGEIVLSLSQPDVAHPTRSGNWVQTGSRREVPPLKTA
jgi:hypothetical protein